MDASLPPASARLVTGLSDLASSYDVVLCDVWGVIHNGQACFPAAVDALMRFRAGGGTVILITNAPRPNGPVREQLQRLGLPQAAHDGVVTSGDVTVASIAARGAAPLFHIGPERDLALFETVSALTGIAPRFVDLDDAEYVVATGLFGEETDTPETYDPILWRMRARHLPMICANPDLIVHIGTQVRYCAGAVAERYRSQGGDVFYAGKPHAPIYETCLAEAAKARGGAVARDRVLCIGDALRTDVAGAVLQGLDVLFVTTGIHRNESHRTGDDKIDTDAFGRMLATAHHRPQAAIPWLAW